MPLRVKKLIARVRVRKGRQGNLLQQSEGPARPGMAFARPTPELSAEAGSVPSQTASESHISEERQEATATPRRADARAVADRVYELMKEELRLSRLRGKPW